MGSHPTPDMTHMPPCFTEDRRDEIKVGILDYRQDWSGWPHHLTILFEKRVSGGTCSNPWHFECVLVIGRGTDENAHSVVNTDALLGG